MKRWNPVRSVTARLPARIDQITSNPGTALAVGREGLERRDAEHRDAHVPLRVAGRQRVDDRGSARDLPLVVLTGA